MDDFLTDNISAYAPVIDVWTKLSETKKPIVMYGMGDGAEKILRVFDRYGLKPAEFMASDEFVRGHSFKGYQVRKLSEIEEMYEDFIVVVCFGTCIPEVMDRLGEIAQKHEVVAPDVPVVGSGLFDGDFISDHEFEIMKLRMLFADDKSRDVLDAIMKYRVTGDIGVLRGSETDKAEMIELMDIGLTETFVDLGAYIGDTVDDFLRLTQKRFTKIYAVEPDQKNYSKLRRRNYALGSGVFEAINAAAWSSDTTLYFHNRAGRNSSVNETVSTETNGRAREVDGRSVDSILNGKEATIIKYDVEGCEKEALIGSEETIKNFKPRLIVSLYHRTEDLITLPLLIKEMNPEYRFYLRHHPYIPAWDTNLYCI